MIIIPQHQVKRENDIYISFLSSLHCVCPAGKYLAFLSTTVETKDSDNPANLPKIYQELQPAIQYELTLAVAFSFFLDIFLPFFFFFCEDC
jgi:Rab GDP dissociation inhibitor